MITFTKNRNHDEKFEARSRNLLREGKALEKFVAANASLGSVYILDTRRRCDGVPSAEKDTRTNTEAALSPTLHSFPTFN